MTDLTKQKALDFDSEVLNGNIPGKSYVRLTAQTADLPQTIDVVGNVGLNFDFNFSLSSETWVVVSDSPDDTFGGTGVQTIEILLIDDNLQLITKTVNMNGTTDVPIPIDNNVFSQGIRCILIDPGEASAGKITLKKTTGEIRSVIMPGTNRSSDGVALVPEGFTWALKNATPNTAKGDDGTFLLQSTTGTDGIFLDVAAISIYQGAVSLVVKTVKIEENSLMRIIAYSSNPNSFGLVELVFLQEQIA